MKWQLEFNKDLKVEEYITQMMAKNLAYLAPQKKRKMRGNLTAL